MPKQKRSQDHAGFYRMDEIPPLSGDISRARQAAGELAAFYGFERVSLSLLQEPRDLAPFVKAGMLDGRPPVYAKTRTGAEFALRSSGTLSSLLAYRAHKLEELPHPVKLYSEGPSFASNPAAEDGITAFSEGSLAFIGEEGPVAEAEIMQVVWKTFERLGLDLGPIEFRVNATGCVACRPLYRSSLMGYLRPRQAKLCRNCRRSMKGHPNRVFSCRDERCHLTLKNAPPVLDFLCEVCKKHLRGLLEFLEETRLPYRLDHRFFADAHWYDGTIFSCNYLPPARPETAVEEAAVENPAKNAVAPGAADASETIPENRVFSEPVQLAVGGRMTLAAELAAGKRIHAAGGDMSFAAIASLFSREEQNSGAETDGVFLAHLGELAKRKALLMIECLRESGIPVRESLGRDSIKSQLRVAERLGIKVALIIGQKEALDETVIVREMQSGMQETIPQDKLVEFLERKALVKPEP